MAGARWSWTLAGLLAVLAPAAVGGTGAVLVADLYEAAEGPVAGSEPDLEEGASAAIGPIRYFSASDGLHGRELWRSDGLPEGTWLVADIAPGAYGSDPRDLVAFGALVCFTADDGGSGREPWCSDGTAAGTRRLADVRAGRASSYPRSLASGAGRLYFVADDGEHGSEPWSSDGTAAGTALLRDVASGTPGSAPDALTVASGVLFFAATHPDHGRELWRSNGTAGGTVLVRDIAAGATSGLSSGSGVIGAHGGLAYFQGRLGGGYTLWRSDGSFAGTVPVTPGGEPVNPFLFTSTSRGLVFLGNSASGLGFWCSDGTEAGTVALGLQAGLVLPGSFRIAEADGWVYIPAGPSTTLWRSDCTPGGTAEVPSADPYDFVEYLAADGDTLFFSAGSAAGAELHWLAGGEVALFADLVPGPTGSRPQGLQAAAGGLLLSIADPQAGRELRLLHEEAVWPVRNIATDHGSSRPRLHAARDGHAWLSARGDGIGRELWTSDGTAAGTVLLADAHPGLPSGIVAMDRAHMAAGLLDGALLYLAVQPTSGEEPWRSDGSPAGTALLADACAGPCTPFTAADVPDRFEPAAGLAFFDAPVSGIRTLWRSDGTADGTVPLLVGLRRPNPGLRTMAGAGERLLFTASDGAFGMEPWSSDGSPQGTAMLRDIAAGAAGSGPEWWTVAGAHAFFTADDGVHGVELWTTDGTQEGTVLVVDLAPGAASSSPQDLAMHGGVLYFSADDGVSGREPWRSDGTAGGTWLVADLVPGANGSEPRNLQGAGGVLYFTAFDPDHGVEPWLSTGTAMGTRLLRDMVPGPGGSVPELSSFSTLRLPPAENVPYDADSAIYRSPFELLDLGDGRVVFRGCTAAAGCQLWITDTTAEGTQPLTAIGSVPGGAMPGHLEWVDGRVLFAATDSGGERELWAVAVAPRPAAIFRDGYEAGP